MVTTADEVKSTLKNLSVDKAAVIDSTLDWPQSLMSFFSKIDNLSKIAIYKLYLEVEVLDLDVRKLTEFIT